MLNLKTTVSVPTEVSIELETPAFYKQGHYFLGVIEECVINIFHIEGMRTWMSNDSVESSKKEIIRAYNEWEHITEEEFMEALDKALKDFNFKPSLVLTGNLMNGEEARKSATGNY